MEQDKSKQIAPQVVLAQHGNKDAMRNIYIQYYKNIFFICKLLTGNAAESMNLASQIFIKMFASVDKLDDHMAFEQWFYSLAVNMCKACMTEDNEKRKIVTDNMKKIADSASQAAKSGDKYTFERSLMKLLEEMIIALPNEAKIIFCYRNFALLEAEKIALLEKCETETVEKSILALNILSEKQTAKLKELGVDISPFVRDPQSTLSHLAAKTFVPDGVHETVSNAVGINVDPYANKTVTDAPVRKEKVTVEVPKKEKSEKKIFSKGDLILFLVVLAISGLIFSGVKIYRSIKNDETTTVAQQAETVVKPVLAWNGAAAGSFDSGSGTADDPFIISNGGQLAYLANLVNGGNSYYSGLHYKLDCDIVLNDTQNYSDWGSNAPENKWTPIGESQNDVCFSGTFDGDGHTVSGMYVSGEHEYSGLFGVVKNGSIKNLNVEKSYVSGKGNCGGIIGCFISNVMLGSDIKNCSFSGSVISSADNAGGIVGYINAVGKENFMVVYGCCSTGTVTAAGNNAGGIAGLVYADSGDVKLSECFSVCTVSSGGENAGGVAGNCRISQGDCSVYNCYNSGKISGGNDESTGAITGSLESENGSGVVTVMYCTSLENCAPTLTGKAYADSMVVKSVKTATDSEMKSADTFEVFDFDSVWMFAEDAEYKYPVLQSVDFNEISVSEIFTGQ